MVPKFFRGIFFSSLFSPFIEGKLTEAKMLCCYFEANGVVPKRIYQYFD